jgi:hypothetical protein
MTKFPQRSRIVSPMVERAAACSRMLTSTDGERVAGKNGATTDTLRDSSFSERKTGKHLAKRSLSPGRLERVECASLFDEVRTQDQTASMLPGTPKCIWAWGAGKIGRMPGRKGQQCRVIARGAGNSCLIEFADGAQFVTSRNGLRRERA